jgi:hypothetical protein
VAEEKLDLFEFSSGGMAQASASAAVMPHAALPSLCRMSDNAETLKF